MEEAELRPVESVGEVGKSEKDRSIRAPGKGELPSGLRTWFVIHFVVDLIFAVPLLLIPERFLHGLGWQVVDPIASRLVGAALLGIGVESLLGRGAGPELYLGMLNLKIVWAAGASFGLGWGLIMGGPPAAAGALAAFLVFLAVWIYYRAQLQSAVGK